MRRLVRFDIGGIPYVNTDFTEILQNEHLKCYSGILDGMNQQSYTGRDRGIILKGCDVVVYNPSAPSWVLDFRNSMVYFDGEFYQYNDTTISTTTFIGGTNIYLYPATFSNETRYLRDLTSTASVIEPAYFVYTNTEPVTGPFIKFSNGGTSRYFRRILKYFTSTSGDIYISSTTQSFSATGLGFNDMEGFLMLNEHNTNIGPNLSGRFLRGFTNNASISGKDVFTEFGSNSFNLKLLQTPTHSHSSIATTYSMNHVHSLNTSFNNKKYFDDIDNQNPLLTIYDLSSSENRLDTDPPILIQDGWPTIDTIVSSSVVGRTAESTFMRVMETHGIYQNPFSKEWGMSTEGQYHNILSNGAKRGMADSLMDSNLGLHIHTFSAGNIGTGSIGTDGATSSNLPEYRVMVFYTKKYNFTWRD